MSPLYGVHENIFYLSSLVHSINSKSWILYIYICVDYECVDYVDVYTYVCGGTFTWRPEVDISMSSLPSSIFIFLFFFQAEFLTEPEAYCISNSRLPTSPSDLPVSSDPSPGVTEMFWLSHGCWRFELRFLCLFVKPFTHWPISPYLVGFIFSLNIHFFKFLF